MTIEDQMFMIVNQRDLALFAIAEAKEEGVPEKIECALSAFKIAEAAYEAWKPVYLKNRNMNRSVQNLVRSEARARARYDRGLL